MTVGVGICYLIGAGPGDPGLITRRGAECLARAEVLYYDQLAAASFLNEVPAACERIYVGKRAGDHAVPQDEIDRRLCDSVREGRVVVRLKGGDPFVFGRGGEEARALAEAGLPFEIVPGITSGVAGPAYAGIPVTHRGKATSVTLVTGHETPEKTESTIDWQALSTIDGTICFYMGVGNLPMIVERLMAGGRDAQTPIALIERATTVRQRTVEGTLATIVEEVARSIIRPPAMIVVGSVVGLRDHLRW
ncbi:MAG: uroporphyrinogen-III C-methyltransferase, partial [Planctomycetota bacterium]